MNTRYISTNPATGQVFFKREADDCVVFQAALAGLRIKQQAFAALSVPQRTAILLRLAEHLETNKQMMAQMVCEEVGRRLCECLAEIEKSIGLIRYYAHLAPQLLAHQTIATHASLSQVRFEPLGVIFAVMPWNYPIWQILRFAIPALCAGNACLVKPAPSVSKVTAALFNLVDDDLPFAVVFLDNKDIEMAISQTDALAFTGSTQTGRHLASLAGKHLKKCVLELGGSNAFLVFPDADLKQAAHDACYARFRDAGQSCNATKRIIIVDEVAVEFIALFLEECRHLQTGDPMLPETTLAPLHSELLRQQAHRQVEDAIAHGARCLMGGELPEGSGYFYAATVLDHVNSDCRVYHEEVFAPVVSILRARDVQMAIELANDSRFGLGASIYSANTDAAWLWAEQLNTGSVFINRHTSSDLRLPFGGVKDSGFGRELSEFGLYEFVNVKSYWQK